MSSEQTGPLQENPNTDTHARTHTHAAMVTAGSQVTALSDKQEV